MFGLGEERTDQSVVQIEDLVGQRRGRVEQDCDQGGMATVRLILLDLVDRRLSPSRARRSSRFDEHCGGIGWQSESRMACRRLICASTAFALGLPGYCRNQASLLTGRSVTVEVDSVELALGILLGRTDPHIADTLTVHDGLPVKMSA